MHGCHGRSHRSAFHFGRHFRGFYGFGFGPGQMFGDPSGRGVGGLGAGRKLGSRDLQLLLLALLSEKPRHGYELIKALDERSNGYYSPSPGMVYPALTYLEEIGHASVEVEGAKKLYRITDEGLAYLEAHRTEADTLVEQLAWIGQRIDRIRRAFTGRGGDADDDFDAPGEATGRARDFASDVRTARRNLKSAMAAKFGTSTEEQKRIAEILERAAREIRGDD